MSSASSEAPSARDDCDATRAAAHPAALVTAACATAGRATAARAEDPPTEVWTAKCKSCHGPDGRAQTQMGKKESIVDMSQPAWQQAQTDADIREFIVDGSPRNKKMKAYKDKLTPQQIDALVAPERSDQAGLRQVVSRLPISSVGIV